MEELRIKNVLGFLLYFISIYFGTICNQLVALWVHQLSCNKSIFWDQSRTHAANMSSGIKCNSRTVPFTQTLSLWPQRPRGDQLRKLISLSLAIKPSWSSTKLLTPGPVFQVVIHTPKTVMSVIDFMTVRKVWPFFVIMSKFQRRRDSLGENCRATKILVRRSQAKRRRSVNQSAEMYSVAVTLWNYFYL